MSKLNPNEAPKGYIAVRFTSRSSCDQCAFAPCLSPACLRAKCNTYERADRTNVLFKKKPTQPEPKNRSPSKPPT